jgi:hypothetical protein
MTEETISQTKAMGLFRRLRLGRKSKLDDGKTKVESVITNRNVESPTMADDTDSPLDNNHQNNNISPNNDRNVAQLRTVRFPAKDALKTRPGRSRRELPKPPTAREAAYGGPPRYDWIDIVSNKLLHPDYKNHRFVHTELLLIRFHRLIMVRQKKAIDCIRFPCLPTVED